MKLRKIAAAVLSLTLMCGAVPFSNVYMNDSAVYAEEETEYTEGTYGVLTYKNYGDYIEISDCDSSATEVEIPAEIDGVKVTSIGNWAFAICWELTKITIPDSVTIIGISAFYECYSLTEVTLPNSVTSIGDHAFYWCQNLVSITLSNSVTNIGADAFLQCLSLTNIMIPESVKSIGKGAFTCCPSLCAIEVEEGNAYYASKDGVLFDIGQTTLIAYPNSKEDSSYIIPNSVSYIAYRAFGECKNLTSISISDNVENIESEAFVYCENITSITLPNRVDKIEDYTFYGCTNLTEIAIPDSVTSIGNFAFYDCENLTNIALPDGVNSIEDYTFCGCTNLSEITIPNSVTSIGESAFYGCANLSEITIPDSVTSIGGRAFALTPWLDNQQEKNPLVIVNGILIDASTCTGNVIIPNNVTCIALNVFYSYAYDESITAITIENSNCQIPDYFLLFPETVAIYGYENSTAQAYAEKYGYDFVSLGEYVETLLGDTDGDGVINSSDASSVLAAYAKIATGGQSPFTEAQTKAADVNKDGAVDSSDASSILAYYAYTATGGQSTLEEFLG